MQKTEHYALNQWELSDRIMMEDFNADNAKIDAALNAVKEANRYVHLRTIVTTEDLPQVDVDLSDIDWSVYPQLILRVKGEATGNNLAYLLINGVSGFHYQAPDGLGIMQDVENAGYIYLDSSSSHYFTRVTVTGSCKYPQCDIYCAGRAKNDSAYFAGPDNNGATLETLNVIASSGELNAGLTITIYGAKF